MIPVDLLVISWFGRSWRYLSVRFPGELILESGRLQPVDGGAAHLGEGIVKGVKGLPLLGRVQDT
jgi:hypothetical protein